MPDGFKQALLDHLNVQYNVVAGTGDTLLADATDRDYRYNPLGQWHISVQHMDAGPLPRLMVDLDKPMTGSVLVYDDFDYHWALGPFDASDAGPPNPVRPP